VPFEVIPAIDVSQGRLARLEGRRVVGVEAFGGDPLSAAAAFREAGARRVHLVDLDLALQGWTANLDVVRAVAKLGLSVQGSGGVRSGDDIDGFLEAGADRVVLGSAALADQPKVESLLANLGEKIVVGLEVDGETVRPRGSRSEDVSIPLDSVLRWLRDAGAIRFLVTDVRRTGSLSGVDATSALAVARITKRPVLVAGGVATVEDVKVLAGLAPVLEGAIVGRLLYEGTADLAAALAARDHPPGGV
jgi:phosphoribosylformimino-5-aminoimidazole carboxamide ribonucleotide (ProFAR) isomerase